MRILTLDPGNHTGWFFQDTITGEMMGGTIGESLIEVHGKILSVQPDVVVYETFNLYPGAAKALTHSEFYPCQVIGVIKLTSLLQHIPLCGQAPSTKKYSGGLDDTWKKFLKDNKDVERTEHIKDSYLHLRFFKLHNMQKYT